MLASLLDKLYKSARWKNIFLLGAAFVLLQAGLINGIGAWFEHSSGGLKPFDLCVFIPFAEIYRLAQQYTSADMQRYLVFSALDFVFPLVGALWYSLLVCRALQQVGAHQRPGLRLLPLLPFCTCLLDWGENMGYLCLLAALPKTIAVLPLWAGICGRMKICSIWLSSTVIALLYVWVVFRALQKRRGGMQ